MYGHWPNLALKAGIIFFSRTESWTETQISQQRQSWKHYLTTILPRILAQDVSNENHSLIVVMWLKSILVLTPFKYHSHTWDRKLSRLPAEINDLDCSPGTCLSQCPALQGKHCRTDVKSMPWNETPEKSNTSVCTDCLRPQGVGPGWRESYLQF